MYILKKSKFKLLITFAVIFSFVILLNTKVQAAGISISGYGNTILAGQTKEYFVSNATQASNWSVYTEKNNNVISAYKRTDRGYTRIECKALKVGTARLCVRDGVTGVVGYINITVTAPASDLRISRKSGGVLENNVLNIFSDFSSSWTVTSKHGWSVYSPNAGIIKVTSPSNFKCNGGTATLTFKALRSDISYISGNPGLTYITITEHYTGKQQKIWVRVLTPVKSIKITNIPKTFRVNDTVTLVASTTPTNYVGRKGYGNVIWRSSNSNIATVNQKGKVTFKQKGNVRISVEYRDGLHGSCIGYVDFNNIASPPRDLKLPSNKSFEIFAGFKKTISITSKNGWTWYVAGDNENTIKVLSKSNSGITFLANKPGYAQIKVKEEYYDDWQILSIHVLEPVKSIKITNAPTNIKVGQTYKLNAQTSAVNYVGRAGYGTTTWSTSNSNVATVDSNGNLRVNNYGRATITVTYTAGSVVKVTDSFSINLVAPASNNNNNSNSNNNNNNNNTYQSTQLKYYSDNKSIDTSGFRITGQRRYSLTDDQKRTLAYIATREQRL